MILQALVTVLLLFACVLQLAVRRAPELRDSAGNVSSRRVLMAGMFVLLVWLVYRTAGGDVLDPVPTLGVGLVVLAEVMFCMTRLLPGVSAVIGRAVFGAPHASKEDVT